MLLYLVRHGESSYNAEGRIQGQSNVPLSTLGRQQSQAVASALAAFPIGALFASPLRRAMETALPIAEVLGLEIQTEPRLMEINVGIFQHKLRSDLQRECAAEYARWLSEDPDYKIPGGESRRELMHRGRAAFESVCRCGQKHVVAVSHGRLLTVTLKDLLGIPPQDPPFSLQNASITTVAHHRDGRFELVSLDRVEHLEGTGLGSRGDL
jgi:probable phosphoglycerate mutase